MVGALERVLAVADDAAAVLRERWGDPGVVRDKPGDEAPGQVVRDLVTEVDTQVEDRIAQSIFDANPAALLLAEEGGARSADGSRVAASELARAEELWIVDPIDGTINFAYGIPGFCVSIARFAHGEPVATAIADPVAGETFVWSVESGSSRVSNRAVTHHGGAAPDVHHEQIAVRDAPCIDSILGLGSMPPDRFRAVARSFRSWRRMGSAALNLAYVACGRVGAYVQFGDLNAWDVAAGIPLILGAGGIVTCPDGSPWQWNFDGPGGLIAAAPGAHSALGALL